MAKRGWRLSKDRDGEGAGTDDDINVDFRIDVGVGVDEAGFFLNRRRCRIVLLRCLRPLLGVTLPGVFFPMPSSADDAAVVTASRRGGGLFSLSS